MDTDEETDSVEEQLDALDADADSLEEQLEDLKDQEEDVAEEAIPEEADAEDILGHPDDEDESAADAG